MSTYVTTTTHTTKQTQDMRTAVEGSVTSLIAPGSAVSEHGAVVAAAGARVTQKIYGMTGEDVEQLLSMVNEDQASSRDALVQLGTTWASGLQSAQAQTSQILADTKAPEATTITKIMPLLLVLAAGYFLLR